MLMSADLVHVTVSDHRCHCSSLVSCVEWLQSAVSLSSVSLSHSWHPEDVLGCVQMWSHRTLSSMILSATRSVSLATPDRRPSTFGNSSMIRTASSNQTSNMLSSLQLSVTLSDDKATCHSHTLCPVLCCMKYTRLYAVNLFTLCTSLQCH